MKKGISLIVLVITIIVLAILAGAVIISLSNQNIITQSSKAKNAADLANAKNAVTLAYAEAVAKGNANKKTTGFAYSDEAATKVMTDTDYKKALENAGFKDTSIFTIEVDTTTGFPKTVTSSLVTE